MSAVLGWLKAHLLIVVFGVLIVILPPAGFVGSSMWNTRIRTEAENTYEEEKRKLDSSSSVTYALPAIAVGEQAVSDRRPPNAAVSRAYRAEWERRQAEVEEVVTSAVRFNKGEDRAVLVQGLFPDPDGAREQRDLTDEFLRRVVGTDEVKSVYEALFERINAGMPPSPVEVARVVTQFEERELDRLIGSADRNQLSDEQTEELNEALRSQRIAVYQQRADEVSVYGGVEALRGASAGFSVIPETIPQSRPDMDELFVMQHDYWVIEEVLRAVAAANSEAGGLLTEVPRSTVKRIESIRVSEFPEALASAEEEDDFGGGGFGGGQNNAFTGGYQAGGVPARYPGRAGGGALGGGQPAAATPTGATHTGRGGEEDSSEVYDVRRVTLTAIVASERLTGFMDALARTNFMTVTGLTAGPVDVWEDLEQGYFYGSEHVVRATIEIESVWLRQWTRDAMPEPVRDALGVVLPEPVEDGTEGEMADEEAQP
jgi:hypothetical protein